MKRIAIVGHGYVGKSVESLFASRFAISVYDIAKWNDRKSCLGADIAFICVPTPMLPDGRADVSAVEESVRWIDAPLIVIKSTVPPGTTDRLARETGKAVHFSPEFIVERSPVETPDGFVIVGGPNASEVLDWYQAVLPARTRFVACRAIEAELAKYMDNAYFATKVTFCNEFAGIAEAHGVDYKVLRELWLLDPRIERDHTAVFADDPGFGGKCLPKDLAAIIAAARSMAIDPTLLKAVWTANEGLRREMQDKAA